MQADINIPFLKNWQHSSNLFVCEEGGSEGGGERRGEEQEEKKEGEEEKEEKEKEEGEERERKKKKTVPAHPSLLGLQFYILVKTQRSKASLFEIVRKIKYRGSL